MNEPTTLKPDFPGPLDRGRREAQTFARFVAAPENRAALRAAQAVAESVGSNRRAVGNPVFLHGPAGTGKTHLVSAMVGDVLRQSPTARVIVLAAADYTALLQAVVEGTASDGNPLDEARQCDLVVIEDLQHLPTWASEPLTHLVDFLLARQQQMVFTASLGPAQLDRLGPRLVNRLVGGLVVGIEALAADSRLALLTDRVQRRHLPIRPDVLKWLAENLTGTRQLEGALTQLEILGRQQAGPLELPAVQAHFQELIEATRPTVESITRRVGGYFQVEPRLLRSSHRSRRVLLPRQVSMFLARQLTGLSLEQIGAYFGGRDHSTVLHACRKVEEALHRDVSLAGAVRQLQAEFV